MPEAEKKNGKACRLIVAGLVAVSLLFFFARLGHYAFWDDEAITALIGKGVLQTGDTSAVIGDNIVAYKQGSQLRDLHERCLPPLPSFLAAASFAVFGESAWAGRLPFALGGFGVVLVFIAWVRSRMSDDPRAWLILAFGILGNVSLFLFSRQCRYYGVAMFASVALVWLYTQWRGQRSGLFVMLAVSLALLASNYINFACLYVCLLADYCLWQRREHAWSARDLFLFLAPQVALGLCLVSIWNPLQMKNSLLAMGFMDKTMAQRLTSIGWTFRDVCRNEFGVTLLLVAAPVRAIFGGDVVLRRLCTAFFIYGIFSALVSPQLFQEGTVEVDMRYITPMIPLGIGIGVRLLWLTLPRWGWATVAVAAVAFGSNLLHGTWLLGEKPRSTVASYVQELARPPAEPYTAASNWINAHCPEKATIWVLPDYMVYPLIFHSPRMVYAWQLAWPPQKQFAHLPPIHFMGREWPDYIIVFGINVTTLRHRIEAGKAPYREVAQLDVFGTDCYRPELGWRSFTGVTNFSRHFQGVYIFQYQPKEKLSPVDPKVE